MFEQFQQMPKGMQIVMGGLAAACLLAVAWMIDSRAFLIVLIGLVLVILAIFLWHLYQNWKSRQRAKALSGSLSANSSAAPSSISDPASRAKLDALRQNFGKGMEKFRAAGKDIYSLPWFVVCGEPGSGKTEAVRHCNVGFPPGLQDEMQGAGGTLNMHWWFTNQAVLLDTAGKLLFQEAPPGSTSEWAEFLKLLKKTRPNCPINGLLLVIPSESLIKDAFEDIQRKAGKIAQQLDTIQRTLDVRFPVFILITKCDLINGFREFFSGVKDPQLQHQMTGWSNPQPLDTPFRPDEVDQHLQEVVRRVSRRRLGLMRDPVPADPGKRRVDEVDALFALPASIGALAPRLRKYLETIFVAGEWSAKPLFLRGIYFTSALTEGSALDAELANVLGVPMDQLPEGKAWERERSFFLRDLFVQKIFKEKGLVTRATNTRKLLRRRQWILGGVVGIGLATLVVISLLGRNALRTSVGEELVYWRAGVQADNWSGGRWRPVVKNDLTYSGNDLVQTERGEWSLLEFHEKLQQRVGSDLNVPWVFRPIESVAVRANSSRRQAQRILFEASVVGPIVDANRDRLVNVDTWSAPDVERLAALIQLEGAVHLRGQTGYVDDYPAEDFFTPLLKPSLAGVPDGAAVLDRLIHVFDWTYFRGGDGRNKWPSAWLARGKTLRDNQPLQRGWESLEKSVQAAQTSQKEAFQSIQTGQLTIVRYIDAEKAFLKAASANRSGSSWKTNLDSTWNDLAARRQSVDALVADLKARTGLTGDVTLDSAYRAAVDKVRGEGARASQRIRAAMLKQRAAADAVAQATSGPATEFTLYRDLQRRLTGLDNQLTAQLETLLPPSEQARLADLDAQSLRAATAGGQAGYAARGAIYAEAMRLVSPSLGDGVTLLGRLSETVGEQAKGLTTLRERVAKFDGPKRPEFDPAVQNLLDAAGVVGIESTLALYQKELDAEFAPATGYPLGTGAPLTVEQFRTKVGLLDKARADIAAANVPAEVKRGLESRFARVEMLAAFASALLGADGEPQTVRFQLVKDADQGSTIDRAIGSPSGSRQTVSRVFPSLRVNGKAFRQRGLAANTDVDKPAISARLPKLEFSTTPDPKPTPDAVVDKSDRWGLLRLIQQGSVRRVDGKEWDAVVRFQDSGMEMVLAVTVVCDKPLPPLDRWPTPSAK